jgi:hypothetical protein
MSGTFDGFQIAGQTRHFLVTYADAGDADEILRATAILESCEADLATLEQWFSCDFDSSPYGIWVQVLKGSPGDGSENYGYTSSESSIIQVSGTAPLEGVYVVAGAVAQMLFVAELAEILMDFTGYGWNRGYSAGEGLSRVAAGELHPSGYYASTFGEHGPWVNGWLNASPRPDWVTNTETTDKDSISFGCAIVFIYYLRYQLGYSYAELVKAGGSTLAQTYATLTGQPANGAIDALGALLNDHFPTRAAFQVSADNIFPLYSPPFVACYASPYGVGTPVSLGSTPFEAAICHSPEAQYSYETFSTVTEIDLLALASGLVDGTFAWAINGVELAAPAQTGGTTAQLYVNVPVEITDVAPPASGNNPPPFAAELGITYIVNSVSPTESQLLVRNIDFPGNCSLTFTVSAEESLVADQLAGATTLTSDMTTLIYTMSSSYWAALWPCIAKPVAEASISLAALGSLVVPLNTPDPSPEQINAVLTAMTSYLAGLKQITGGAIGLQGAAASVVAADRRPPQLPPRSIRAGVDGGPPTLSVSSLTVSFRADSRAGRTRGPALRSDPRD